MKERERRSPLLLISVIGGLGLISQAAFSRKIRKQIGKRDNWHCQDEGCDKSFQEGTMVHASHYNHKRGRNYDNPENGRIQCVEHHQMYHEEYVGRAYLIGLTESGNLHAIEMLANTPREVKKKR